MEYLFQLDEAIFLFINRSCQNLFFDQFLPFWRNKFFWTPMYLFFSVLLFLKQGKKVGLFLLFAILTIGLSDFTSSVLIKENIQRIRPCNDPVFKKQVFLRAPCGSGYSFTSSHATNHFALATFIILGLGTFIRKWRYLILFWAISIGFAQIYVGVHYPLDVLVGFLLGALIGGLGAFVYRKAIK